MNNNTIVSLNTPIDYTKYMKNKGACKALGVCYQTLHRWDSLGKIKTIRTPGGVRLYDVDGYLKGYTTNNNTNESNDTNKKQICYCRVSTPGQKDDLERQVTMMKNLYPNYEIIKDIGSGINFKRKGLLRIIDLAISNQIDIVIVAYKDRLCRIGYEIIEYLIEKYSNGKIKVLNDVEGNPEEEVVKDLLQILNVFSARVNGLRKYKNKISEEVKQNT
jgi:predicted site-specific integrase-resolvase